VGEALVLEALRQAIFRTCGASSQAGGFDIKQCVLAQ
jgi:hypothetical protein